MSNSAAPRSSIAVNAPTSRGWRSLGALALSTQAVSNTPTRRTDRYFPAPFMSAPSENGIHVIMTHETPLTVWFVGERQRIAGGCARDEGRCTAAPGRGGVSFVTRSSNHLDDTFVRLTKFSVRKASPAP